MIHEVAAKFDSDNAVNSSWLKIGLRSRAAKRSEKLSDMSWVAAITGQIKKTKFAGVT
eukprot:CAMPEP_0178923666 /NCGR_PEP_ID=MMETSP0786-20121207/16872_1 /TAXON_ID=186022 /ORGANISM="Thalassionema frauenfeldii, Strain CCMP 1798" /LENGTH=57 /DNA_ID=CAMNT_0020598239 /DNA_START=565 /DNA_END=738 /DNA_ORIENTATION=+